MNDERILILLYIMLGVSVLMTILEVIEWLTCKI